MKNKFLIPLIAIFAIGLLFGTAYSAWAFDNVATVSNNVQVEFPGWGFDGDDYIEPNERRGTLINAVEKLDEIKALGINTLHILPIHQPGKSMLMAFPVQSMLL